MKHKIKSYGRKIQLGDFLVFFILFLSLRAKKNEPPGKVILARGV